MQVELTDKFYSDDAIKIAYRATQQQTKNPLAFISIWCGLAKRALQSGQPKIKKPELNKVSLIVESNEQDAPAWKEMEKVGMLKRTDELPASVLGESDYETWFQSYPKRDVSGRQVKVRGRSKVRFFNEIRTREDFELLMKATTQYAAMCNKKPKDPERFLKDEFWREYAPELITGSSTVVAHKTSVNSSQIVDMLSEN